MNFFSDKRLIFRKLKGFGQLFLVAGPVKTPTFYTGREKIKQDLLKFGGIDGPAVCRKADMETENQRTVFGSADFTCGPGKNFLSTAAHGEQAALSGPFCLETELPDLGSKPSQEMIFKGGFGFRCLVKVLWKPVDGKRNPDGYMGRGSERIPLHMIDAESVLAKIVDSFQGFIGRITFPVYG